MLWLKAQFVRNHCRFNLNWTAVFRTPHKQYGDSLSFICLSSVYFFLLVHNQFFHLVDSFPPWKVQNGYGLELYTPRWLFTVDNLAKIMVVKFWDKLGCRVFQTFGWHNMSSLEKCFSSVVFCFFLFLNVGVLGHNRLPGGEIVSLLETREWWCAL